MTDLNNADVQKLLTDANSAVISTHNPDGTILSTVVWLEAVDGFVAVNSAVGRQWPTNLQRDPLTMRRGTMKVTSSCHAPSGAVTFLEFLAAAAPARVVSADLL